MTEMDHTYAEEHDVVELYLADRLSEEERAAFEAHYFDCETCLERLETAEGFRDGMRQVAAEDLAEAAATRQLGLLVALSALSRRPWLAFAGVLLLLAALGLLPSLWFAGQNRALESRLAEATTGSERQRQALETRLSQMEQTLGAERRRLEEELARELQARETPTPPPTPPTPLTDVPQVNVPLFLLAAVRSGEPEGREPVNQLPLAPTSASVILTAELATVDFPSYRAILTTSGGAGGREIWRAQGLHPDSRDTLVLLLPASLLPPGLYRLTIEGVKKDGTGFAVAAYPFRVRRPL